MARHLSELISLDQYSESSSLCMDLGPKLSGLPINVIFATLRTLRQFFWLQLNDEQRQCVIELENELDATSNLVKKEMDIDEGRDN